MTKRLTLVGFAAVAVLWGPYVYAELVRRPVTPPAVESEPIAVAPVVVPTPVAYKVTPHAEPAVDEPEQTAFGTSIDPDLAPVEPEAVPAFAEPPVAEHELPDEPAPEPSPPPPAAEPAAPALAAATAPALPVEPQPTAAAAAPAAPAEPAEAPAPEQPAEAPEQPAVAEGTHEPGARPSELSAHAKAVRDGNVNVIPDALVPAFRSAFDKETRDVMWAAKEEPRISSALSGAGMPSNAIAEVRCQRTVCRVSINTTVLESGSQSQIYERVQQQFGAGLALDPTSQDQRAAFYVVRKAQ